MSHNLELSNADLLTLSAALQVYLNTAPEFGQDVWRDHEDQFPDDTAQEMQNAVAELAERVNTPLRVAYPDRGEWMETVKDMPEDEKRVALLGSYATAGSARFRDMTIDILEQIVHQVEAHNN